MPLLSLSDYLDKHSSDWLNTAKTLLDGAASTTVRLGVTGLSRSGKTVFITALVHALLEGTGSRSLPVLSTLPGLRAYLEPQPDDDIPRFAYEDHLNTLSGPDRTWPQSTRHISQLRVTLEWDTEAGAVGLLGLKRRLHIDIVDYPGEWLLDLSLLQQDFATWSEATLHSLRNRHDSKAKPFLDFLDELAGKDQHSASTTVSSSSSSQDAEQLAIAGAKQFTKALHAVRDDANTQAILGPGRFLWPGDLADTPQITFFPWSTTQPTSKQDMDDPEKSSSDLYELLKRRYEAYKANVVKPFFEDHFQRIDRQIVLIDALTPLNRGAMAVRDLEDALHTVLQAFRPGRNAWLSFLTGRRIDRIVFAATKADHIHSQQHRTLESILDRIIARANRSADDAGAETRCLALASIRATQDINTETDGVVYHCIKGIPVSGESIAGQTYDGTRDAIIFPGDLPKDVLDVFDPEDTHIGDFDFVRFRPPLHLQNDNETNQAQSWPQIGLGKAVAFLFGDVLK